MITLFVVPARQSTKAGKINFLESIPGLLKRLKIWAPSQGIFKRENQGVPSDEYGSLSTTDIMTEVDQLRDAGLSSSDDMMQDVISRRDEGGCPQQTR